MMQPHDPERTRELCRCRGELMRLFGRDEAERVAEGKMCLCIGIEQDHAQSVAGVRRQHHWKDVSPKLPKAGRKANGPGIGECRDGLEIWRNLVGERVAEPLRDRINDSYTRSLHCCDRGKRAHLAQAPAWRRRKIEPGWVGAINHVEIVIARQEKHPLRQLRMTG